MSILGIITLIAVGVFFYFAGGAATAGFYERKWPDDSDSDGAFAASVLWPGFWIGRLVWLAFIKPVVPIIEGIYRVSAGKTWKDDS